MPATSFESKIDEMVRRIAERQRERAAELYAALIGCGLPKDIIVSTAARFERYRNVVNTVYWPAAHLEAAPEPLL